MSSIDIPSHQLLERILSLEIVRVTERAAVAAARLRGLGNEKAADQAAVDAMRRELNNLPIRGTIVIGEGERDEAPMLFIGEKVGRDTGPAMDIAVDPLEGTTLCAKNMPGAIALILDRPRHADMIAAVRKTGAAVTLITDGDVAGVIHTADPEDTGIDIYMGIGGAPEGVLAAAALRCIGGQMQGRLVLDTEEKRQRATHMGIKDLRKKYTMEEMVSGDCLFAATGVTNGSMLKGVKFHPEVIETETVVMRSATGTVRWIRAEHREHGKFYLG